jgi:hypothetical protein
VSLEEQIKEIWEQPLGFGALPLRHAGLPSGDDPETRLVKLETRIERLYEMVTLVTRQIDNPGSK